MNMTTRALVWYMEHRIHHRHVAMVQDRKRSRPHKITDGDAVIMHYSVEEFGYLFKTKTNNRGQWCLWALGKEIRFVNEAWLQGFDIQYQAWIYSGPKL